MLRWRLTLGLLATLIILLLVGVYGVWLFHSLGKAVDDVLRDNYDSIKACHYMRTATARVNIFYSRGERPQPPLDQPQTLNEVEAQLNQQLPILEGNAKSFGERRCAEMLEESVHEYVRTYRTIFELFKKGDPSWQRIKADKIAPLTLKITNLTEKILDKNEHQMFVANQKADQRAKDSIRLLIIAMVSAVTVFVFTYRWLGNSIITPIQNLTDSIRELRSRDFDRVLPLKTNDELGGLTAEFNQMSQELRTFYLETDRKLIELNQIIRGLLTTLPYPLFILGEADRINRLNPAAERFLDSMNSKGMLPRQIEKYLDQAPNTVPDYRLDDLKQAILCRIDEEEVYFLPRIFSIVLEDGTVSGRALMLIDVTRFRQLDDIKSDTLATLSHEIRTPLTSIRLVLHLLLEKRMGALTEEQEELVDSAKNDCERLLKTLGTILDLTRMQSGKEQLNIALLEPKIVVDDAYQSMVDKVQMAGRILSKIVHDPLPKIAVDRERIALVLSNFLSNAIKYSSPETEMVLSARPGDAESVRFSVINRGPGLTEEEQAKVFDKFYRSPRLGGEGAGLGLSIARQIILAHDGKMGVISELNGKTEFYFELPSPSGSAANVSNP
jgi:two-component system, NtrC family, sensor histidine kinase KinB